MDEPKSCQGCCPVTDSIDGKSLSDRPRCAEVIRRLISAEIECERARAAAEEAGQWDRAFGAAAPADRKLRGQRIIEIASARAFLSKMTKPP